ncbi:sensor domain-containing diguanylate cyclase [Vibrio alginolyticus]|uniref:sensor domain-containing diguanylate cyclase n=1 Tax=Vibrio alginolyticus TaxID=663 RepID=UPI001F0D5351|nr:diguanylate cyclase [Vibrio alginolyticus]MCR9352217.1 diguanylate cyclase [Vibrio alginolyticus]MCR9362457.1 diguanylate cyclase [Vibrio alginolyticus]MCS0126038.1 diguanylate cyclase [Vibrio alginolyticus]MCS0135828.1 diguanylate cyclase [Vibrio alginolyticus]MCS0187602.1 diguanylate cyclase [Vibrio alginolyticus]
MSKYMPKLNIDSNYGLAVLQNFKLVYVDDNYARIFGYHSAKELMSNVSSFLDLIDPKYHQMARDNYYQQINKLATPRGRTFLNIDRYGRRFTVFTIDHVIEWEGSPAVQVTVIDLSMLEHAQEKMRQNEEKYKRLILSSLQGIVVHRKFKPVMVNQAWVDLIRAPSKSFVLNNVNLLNITPEYEKESTIERYYDLMTGRIDRAQTVVENICFDGEKRYFNVYDTIIEWDGEAAVQSVVEDVTKNVELERKLVYQAHHDQLTGLWNRNAMYDWFAEKGSNAKSLSCILLDIDDFKHVNDKFGHKCGDTAIQCLAKLCLDVVSNKGVVARWGGEEFVIFLLDINLDEVFKLSERIRLKYSQHKCTCIKSRIQRTVSVGATYCNNLQDFPKEYLEKERHVCMEWFIQESDKNLYRAKHRGKNQVQYSALIIEGDRLKSIGVIPK